MSATLARRRPSRHARSLAADRRNGVPFGALRETGHLDAKAARDYADWQSWLEVANKAPRTLEAYGATVAALLAAYPDKQIGEFTDADLLRLLASYPAKSRNQNKSHLASFFGWAYKWDRRIDANPVDRLPSIKYVPNRVYDVFNDAETDALCALPAPDGALMALLLWCGLRRAEARMLTVKRLNFESLEVIVIDGAKGGKARKVPMLNRVEQALSELVLIEGLNRDDHLWYDQPGDHLAPVRRSKSIGNTSFTEWWGKRIEAAGVRYRNPHMARHSYATALRAKGVPMEDIQRFLGHESIRTTADTYVHADDASRGRRLRELVEATV